MDEKKELEQRLGKAQATGFEKAILDEIASRVAKLGAGKGVFGYEGVTLGKRVFGMTTEQVVATTNDMEKRGLIRIKPYGVKNPKTGKYIKGEGGVVYLRPEDRRDSAMQSLNTILSKFGL